MKLDRLMFVFMLVILLVIAFISIEEGAIVFLLMCMSNLISLVYFVLKNVH